jgi:hypothetical protein
MWQPKTVERALFNWQKWRNSIISEWIKPYDDIEDLLPRQIKDKARQKMQQIGFPPSLFLEIYWLCCIASDYNLDYPTTYENIVIPSWLPLPPSKRPERYYRKSPFINRMKPGFRIYPPPVLGESDIDFLAYEGGYEAMAFFRDVYYPKENYYGIFLLSDHPFSLELKKIKGRPKCKLEAGRAPSYSDRLAVKCATLKGLGKSFVEIAGEFGLPIKKLYSSHQSDTARHLVDRGTRLINELDETGD